MQKISAIFSSSLTGFLRSKDETTFTESLGLKTYIFTHKTSQFVYEMWHRLFLVVDKSGQSPARIFLGYFLEKYCIIRKLDENIYRNIFEKVNIKNFFRFLAKVRAQ